MDRRTRRNQRKAIARRLGLPYRPGLWSVTGGPLNEGEKELLKEAAKNGCGKES